MTRFPFSVAFARNMHPAWQIDHWRGYMRVCLSDRRVYVWWGPHKRTGAPKDAR